MVSGYTFVLVRVFQRNRTNSIWVYIEINLLQGIGSHNYSGWQVSNLQGGLAGWRPGKSQHCSSRPETIRLKSQRRTNIAVQVGRLCAGRICYYSREVSFLFYLGLQLIGWEPPTLQWAVFFTQSSPISILISFKNTFTKISSIMFGMCLGMVGQPSWHTKWPIHTTPLRLS